MWKRVYSIDSRIKLKNAVENNNIKEVFRICKIAEEEEVYYAYEVALNFAIQLNKPEVFKELCLFNKNILKVSFEMDYALVVSAPLEIIKCMMELDLELYKEYIYTYKQFLNVDFKKHSYIISVLGYDPFILDGEIHNEKKKGNSI